MGAVMVDIGKDARKYVQTYALNTAKGVEKLLRDRHKIAARRFTGDYAACDIIIDLNEAIDRANLSRRQTETITYLYGCDLTQAKAAEEMAVTQPAVAKFNAEACRKIARVFRDWDYGAVSIEISEVGETSSRQTSDDITKEVAYA
ncbi:RNA polymerase subunit sigma [Paenibacillus dendritiformis]|uniref:RNA polymerase subunit sigma n=1 Tax=Paenibacillus dendritiformis TaxID=130049 RepID=UPI00387E0724